MVRIDSFGAIVPLYKSVWVRMISVRPQAIDCRLGTLQNPIDLYLALPDATWVFQFEYSQDEGEQDRRRIIGLAELLLPKGGRGEPPLDDPHPPQEHPYTPKETLKKVRIFP